MGHYWSEMRGPETPLERKQKEARDAVAELRRLPASSFSVDEVGLLLRVGWSQFKRDYNERECDEILALRLRSIGLITDETPRASTR